MLSTLVLRTQPDARLVELSAAGSEAAFEIIVQRYRRELLGYCSRLLVADGRAEDVVQQALLAAWSALRASAEVRQLRPWLYRITHNQAMSALRRPGWTFAELSEQISGQPDGESGLERRMLMRETLAAVAALSGPQREAILRTAVEGESYAEAAQAMGLTGTAVRGLVQRARVNIRAAVAAFTPAPLVLWAAGAARRHSSLLGLLSDAASSGGPAGAAGAAGASAGAGAVGVAVKSAALLATSAAVVGSGIAAHPSRLPARAHHHVAVSPRHVARSPVRGEPSALVLGAHAPAADRGALAAGGTSEVARTAGPRPVSGRFEQVALVVGSPSARQESTHHPDTPPTRSGGVAGRPDGADHGDADRSLTSTPAGHRSDSGRAKLALTGEAQPVTQTGDPTGSSQTMSGSGSQPGSGDGSPSGPTSESVGTGAPGREGT